MYRMCVQCTCIVFASTFPGPPEQLVLVMVLVISSNAVVLVFLFVQYLVESSERIMNPFPTKKMKQKKDQNTQLSRPSSTKVL